MVCSCRWTSGSPGLKTLIFYAAYEALMTFKFFLKSVF
jgi:hypothetical protein